MEEIIKALESLKIMNEREKEVILNFEEFLKFVVKEPFLQIRNIFQLFYDMVVDYVGEGKDEYPGDPESIGFINYDCSKVFERTENPFFADRLFANRFMRQIKNLKLGAQQNRIYVFEGPPGCGKSTFLNNLLSAFEEYTRTEKGRSFEILWQIEIGGQKIEIPCPSHDHPLLIIPKDYRIDFLDKLLSEKMTEVKYKISHEKEYEWLFQEEACTICRSIFEALLNKLGSIEQVLKMLKVRPRKFDRRIGEGISIFNPGDKPIKQFFLTNEQIQNKLDQVFGINTVRYVYSPLAKTNNGIYVLMDIKGFNKERLLELHNVISEGIHKVNGTIEERINSLFIALMNPEDKVMIMKEGGEGSYQERIQYNKIGYVLVPSTEVKIYRSVFGDIERFFLPRVLESFAKIVIASRMNLESPVLKEWLKDLRRYEKYTDENGLLLRMELYNGIIPSWLSDEDRKKFTAKIRKKLIIETENEGMKGFSGRDSIKLFSDFFSQYKGNSLININHVATYFKGIDRTIRDKNIPQKFIDSLVNWYDYSVLSEIKEAIYFFNPEQIKEDILHYLWAINYDLGSEVECKYTGKKFLVTFEFLRLIGSYICGRNLDDRATLDLAKEIQQKYVNLLAQNPDQKITETQLYKDLFDSYIKNLKEKALEPFVKNKEFCEAIKAYGSKMFETYDGRIVKHISYMIKNLVEKFGYTEAGAKEICLYVIEKKLVEKFS